MLILITGSNLSVTGIRSQCMGFGLVHVDYIDIDIFGFIKYLMYGNTGSYLSPPPPQSSLSRSGAGVGIAYRVRLP